jgi:hypothetical protein
MHTEHLSIAAAQIDWRAIVDHESLMPKDESKFRPNSLKF